MALQNNKSGIYNDSTTFTINKDSNLQFTSASDVEKFYTKITESDLVNTTISTANKYYAFNTVPISTSLTDCEMPEDEVPIELNDSLLNKEYTLYNLNN